MKRVPRGPRSYRKRGNPWAGAEHLVNVVSIPEAAKLFHVHHTTIRYHINRGNVAYRRTGKTYLVSVPSLISYYGRPPSGWFFLKKSS